jgi:hypothetical protein
MSVDHQSRLPHAGVSRPLSGRHGLPADELGPVDLMGGLLAVQTLTIRIVTATSR